MTFFNQMKRSRNNPDSVFVRVAKDAKEGYWEVDTKNNKALFRNNKQKLLPSDYLHDYTESHNTITEFLKANQEVQSVKDIIRDRKVVFSDTEICGWSMPNKKTGVPIHCTQDAWVYHDGKAYCEEHAKQFITL